MDHFAETPEGMLVIANGHDAPLRWDSLTSQAEGLGLAAPASAPTLAGSGVGGIVGTYFAYVRYLDRLGLVSNLSPVSAALVLNSTTKAVTDASNQTPILITTGTAHGLADGNLVNISGVGGNLAANGKWYVHVITGTTFRIFTDATLTQGVQGSGSYNGGGTVFLGRSQINYTNVPATSDPKVARRQILRNTDGETQIFYVDVDTTDLVSTSFNSVNTDDVLSANTAVELLDTDGSVLANRNGLPPNHKPYFCYHLGFMLAAGQLTYSLGNVKVSFGSPTVTGVGTHWTSAMAGRLLYVVGSTKVYTIQSVNVSAQTLTLTVNWDGNSDAFAAYAIRSAPEERKRIYWSAPGLVESWNPTNSVDVQQDGDDVVGVISLRSFAYILERRQIYKFTFQDNPGTDGVIFPSANRGCINDRCWQAIDDAAYMLDEYGVHRFVGNAQSEPVSGQIQEVFRPKADTPLRINWAASKFFHSCLYRPQNTIRWFVALSGSRVPRHALCYNYEAKRWWIEPMREHVGGSCSGNVGDVPKVFYGGPARTFYEFWVDTTDVVNSDAGTVRGVATAVTPTSLTDANAAFPAATVVNANLCIVDGPGRGQVRRIVAVAGQKLKVDMPWLVLPDATSVYQIGGIPWSFKSGWFRLSPLDTSQQRRIEVIFQQALEPATMDMQLYYNFSVVPEAQKGDRTFDAGGGIRSTNNEPFLTIDLTQETGLVQHQLPHSKEYFARGKRYSQFGLSGFSNRDVITIFEISYEGVLTPGGVATASGG